MPVPSSISDLSTTPALNSPPGSESPSLIDDYLRTLSAFIRQISDASVQTSGNQTVAGTKTFSASPVVPDATAAKHPVTKDQHDTKAPLASPAFTGDPTAPTQATGDSSTKIANTAFVANTSLGIGQTLQDVKASRAIGTTYTNTTGKPIVVSISFQSTAEINAAIFYMGALVFGQSSGGFTGAIFNVCAIVPPGGTYRVTTDFANVIYWAELR